ncbi:SGNH/GDSL hydrolase family protein [Oricola nitratireducens]|uniref:SGNH/GDSL hydrolase family protein n=1 Tax=Oricola nitratireducens TaxID=2775868 RepID=UPI001867B6D9|nr:DUF459 domain-containing protein [Oricola nitratireducens]
MAYLFRIFRLFVTLALATVFVQGVADLARLPGLATAAAHAQEQQRQRTLLDLLFRGGGSRPQIQEVPPQSRAKRPSVSSPRKSRSSSSSRVEPASAPPQDTVEKLETARVILVVGDFIAGGLAQGLEEAFADVPTIKVVSRANGSSGFVRDDFYDWPASIGPILEEEKPALVIMMIGSNDRQAMRVDGHSEKVRTEAWDKEYVARVNRFAAAVRASGVPFIWVGGPPFRFKSMSADILAFNEFYRTAVEAVGGSFVDIWDGFVDQDGAFVQTGSDINGQTVRLRNSDGINFTKEGKRKLAFYVERQIRQMFGDATAPLLTVLAPESYSTMRLPPLQGESEFVRFDPIPLSDPDLDGGTALLGDINAPVARPSNNPLQAKTLRQQLVQDGVPPPPKPGRANDFDWPG